MHRPRGSFQSHTSAFREAGACKDAPGGSRKSNKVKVKGVFAGHAGPVVLLKRSRVQFFCFDR